MTKPVFNDETGRRAAVLLWAGRVVIAVCAILGVAIAFTLTTHIALPGLDGLVSPTLNGNQPDVALPTDPGTVGESDVTRKSTYVPDPTTTRRRGKSVSSPSHSSTALAAAAHPVATGSATAKTRVTTASSRPAQSKATARNSHAATPGTRGRGVRPTSKPIHPSQAKSPVH